MAKLKLENGKETTDLSIIAETLAPLGVQLSKWKIPENEKLKTLLDKPALTDAEKESALAGLDSYFEDIKAKEGYQTRDMIVLNPNIEGLDGLLAKFKDCHTHDDDEVRYIVDGAGTFGFVLPDGSQVTLTVEAEEYINVPKDTEHWFVLTEKKRIKAVRYFTGMEGWVPNYTGTEVRV